MRMFNTYLSEAEVRDSLQAQVDTAGSAAAWARLHNLTPSHVRDVLLGHRGIGPEIQKALGVKRIIHYQKEKARP